MLKFDKSTLITLTAPTCSGKSYLLNRLVSSGMAGRIVSTTTRLPRNGEQEGVDYYFISAEQSKMLEEKDMFFELIEFRGTRYGVTHQEMKDKLGLELAPIVILEPHGLEIYRQKCFERGIQVFQIYVSLTENLRINRLHERTVKDLHAHIDRTAGTLSLRHGAAFREYENTNLKNGVDPIIKAHTDRLLSITGDERRWSSQFSWDAIVPGDNLEKAIEMIHLGVKNRNQRTAVFS